ncbi:MAG: Rieske (2Fe-2S) protein [Flammeovirgaceae bacterium]
MEWVKVFSNGNEMRQRLQEGLPQQATVGGKSICLVVWKGNLKAIENKCPHNGELLSKGKINYWGEVVCPWHGYRFNLTTGREGAERCRDAEIFPVKENDEGVFVGL